MNHSSIRSAQSLATDSRAAVLEFHEKVRQDDMSLVIFFCSSRYDLDALAEELGRCFSGTPIIGCTTAGEIGPDGYRNHSLSGASFSGSAFKVAVGLLEGLQEFSMAKGQAFAGTLLQELEMTGASADGTNTFAFQLIDGLSVREEAVVRTFQNTLGGIPLIGGSAGDDLKFSQTSVYFDGQFHSDSVVMALMHTSLPFRTFKTQHFISEAERMVVTEADPARRTVKEINGLPAAEEYARVIGVAPNDLGSFNFATSPVVVVIDGTDYVRSIQKANPDGSLTFYCAIDEGLVLRVAHGEDLLSKLRSTFSEMDQEIGPLQGVLSCDCILRSLEIVQSGLTEEVGQVFQQYHGVGFSTYGEQFRGVHVNQTLTGIAIGSAASRSR